MVHAGQEARQLPTGVVPVDRVDDVEQGRPRHEPGHQEHGVGAAGNNLRKERNSGFAEQRSQDADFVRVFTFLR